jgi:hypothetical protein
MFSSANFSAASSTIQSSAGSVVLSTGGVGTQVNFGIASNVSGKFAVIVSSPGGISLGSGAGLAQQSVFTSPSGSVNLAAPSGVLSVTNSLISGKFSVSAIGKTITDNGGNGYSIANTFGSINMTGINGLTLGAGTSVTAPSSITMVASTGAMNLGAIGTPLQVTTAGSLTVIGSAGINLSNAQLTGSLVENIIAGAGNIVDAGNSQFTSNGAIGFNGKAITIGSGSTVTAGVNSAINVFGSGSVAIGAGGLATTMTASSININATGNLTTNKATLTTTSAFAPMTLNSATGTFIDAGGSNFNSAAALNITGKSVTVGSAAASILQGGTGLRLTASSGTQSLLNGSTIQTTKGALVIQATGTISLDANLKAGNAAAPTGTNGLYLDVNFLNSGSIAINSTGTAGGITFSSAARTINASGKTTSPGNVTITSTTGSIDLGAGNTFRSDGGNVVILSGANVTGGAANSFIATGTAASAASNAFNTGGGVELGGGSTASQLAAAVNKLAGTHPSNTNILTGGVANPNLSVLNPTLNQNSSGVLQVNVGTGGGTINLISGGTNPATLTLNPGGAIVFDVSKGQSVTLNGATFTVKAYKPIAYTYRVAPVTELLLDDESGDDQSGEVDHIATIFVPGSFGAQALLAKADRAHAPAPEAAGAAGSAPSQERADSVITLLAGELFINPNKPTVVRSSLGEVRIRKGALVSVIVNSSGLRVASCSGPGDVTLHAGGRTIALAPGEEALVSHEVPGYDELNRADGIGRRDSKTSALQGGLNLTMAEFSIVTMLGNVSHLQTLVHPVSAVERRISERMLKTAAALQQIKQGRGAYKARPNALTAPGRESNLLPVTYLQGSGAERQ